MQLVATEVEPGPVESKVRTVSSQCHTENIGVKRNRYIRVINVDRYMMDSQRLHYTILAGGNRCLLVHTLTPSCSMLDASASADI